MERFNFRASNGSSYQVEYEYSPNDGTVLPGESAAAETVVLLAVYLGDRDVTKQIDLRTQNQMLNAALRLERSR